MDQPEHLPLPKRADDLDAVREHIERMLAAGDTTGALDLLFDLLSRLRNHNEATQTPEVSPQIAPKIPRKTAC